MAETKVVNLEVNSNLDETEKSVGSLKSQLRAAQNEVASLSEKFGATSKEAVQAAKRAGELKDKIGDAKSLTDAFNPDAKFKALTASLGGVAGGFAAYQGALGLAGIENKDLEKQILKVQSAMAISQGLQTIGESVDSFKRLGAVAKSYTIVQKIVTAGQWLWNAALAANPIGALVAVIAALIVAGVALVNYFKESSAASAKNTAAVDANKKALDNQTKTLERNNSELQNKQNQELAMAKASGASAESIRKLEIKLIDEKIAYEKSARAIAFNTYEKNKNYLASLKSAGADEELIKKQQETTNKSITEYNKQNQNVQKAFDEKKDIQNRHQVEIRQSQTNHNKEVADKNKQVADKNKEASDKARELEKETENKKQEEEKATLKKIADDKLAADMDSAKKAMEILNELNKKTETPAEKENREYQEKFAVLKANNLNTEELTKKHLDKLKLIDDTDRLAKDQAKAESLDAIISDKTLSFETQLAAVDAEQALYKKQFDDKLITEQEYNKKVKGLAKSRKEIGDEETKAKIENMQRGSALLSNIGALLGKNTAAGKAAAVASATIDTYAAATSAFKNAQANPISILGPAYPFIQAGLAIAGGLKNVQAILDVEVPGGGGGGGGAPSASAPAPPQFNVVGASGANQIAQSINGKEMAPIKAYVLGSDVTTQQSMNRRIVQNASIG